MSSSIVSYPFDVIVSIVMIPLTKGNYSGSFLVLPAAAGEEKGKEARTPRAPGTASPGTPC